MEVAKMKRRVLACLLVPLTCSAYDCRMRYTLSCATPLGLCLPPLYQGGGVALSYIHPDPLPRWGRGNFARVVVVVVHRYSFAAFTVLCRRTSLFYFAPWRPSSSAVTRGV